jgi:acyl-CoA synthetase (AMP-forming)/AMP-acid ligase II
MFDILLRIKELAASKKNALFSNGMIYSYSDLIKGIEQKIDDYSSNGLISKSIILKGDFDYETITSFFALIKLNNIILILTESSLQIEEIVNMINANALIDPNKHTIKIFPNAAYNELINDLIDQKESGIVLLSSGTTGKPKAILHSTEKLFQKYLYSKKPFTTLAFLLFDHIAGLDTMLYTFSAGGFLVALNDRSVEAVIESLDKNNVEVLPTSPSFLNIMLMYPSFDPERLPNLKIITFGSERIAESTLEKLKARFGEKVRIMQKYGITEMGSPGVKSDPDDPAWIKIDRRNTDYKIIDDVLFLKSKSSMIGYIFSDHCEKFDGWYNTQDLVEVRGEWIKILGRSSDIINVGGQKVYPSEVESVLLEIDNIKEASVYALDNPIMGKIVAAKVELEHVEPLADLKQKIRTYCRDRIESFKIPVSIKISKTNMVSERYKKVR